ncbi:nitrilase-related carbon-nitrogen hydrolase, partial [Frateuria sp.]|uniref:nitrilase-related carbon-nitrogen hydrolase n=1 Tax=Frateuria sp. TaxID=2211372 RepID=UPI00180B01D8
MTAKLRLALAQFDFSVGAVAANTNRIRELIAQAHAGGADLVAFPELAVSGYPPEDLLIRPSFLQACNEAIASLAQGTDGIAALVGFPHSEG